MIARPTRRHWSIASITLAAFVAAYFWSYLLLGDGFTDSSRTRRYESSWKLRLFVPAIWLEAQLRRKAIDAVVPIEMEHDPNIEECIVIDTYTAWPWCA